MPVLAMLLGKSRAGVAGLALVLGGAAGNLLSRLTAGSVTDFARLWFWPGVFNLADVFLQAGALLTIIAWLRGGEWRVAEVSRSC